MTTSENTSTPAAATSPAIGQPQRTSPYSAPTQGSKLTARPTGCNSDLPRSRARRADVMARAHIRQLRKRGVTLSAIAQAAGLGTSTVHELLHRRCQPTAATIAAVLRVHPADVRSPRIDAGGTRLRLRALHVMGHGPARLATTTGVSDWTIRQIIDGGAKTVSRRLRRTVVEVYDQWWDKRAPERTPGERAAATLARRRAIRGNWCPPAALDDDLLDTPGYKPRYGWRPATGTGVARDINPAGRLNGRPHR